MLILLFKLSLRHLDWYRTLVFLFSYPLFAMNMGGLSVSFSVFLFEVMLNPAYKPHFYTIQYQVTAYRSYKLVLFSNLILLFFVLLLVLPIAYLAYLFPIFETSSLVWLAQITYFQQLFIFFISFLAGISVANILHKTHLEGVDRGLIKFLFYNLMSIVITGVCLALYFWIENNFLVSLISILVFLSWILSIRYSDILAK